MQRFFRDCRRAPGQGIDKQTAPLMRLALPGMLVAAAILPAVPAQAQTSAVDAFAVKLAKPYTVAPSSHPGNDRAFAITSSAEKPRPSNSDKVLCKAAFKLAPQNASLSQSQINTYIGTDQWRQGARAALARVFKIDSEALFNDKGVAGYEFVAVPLQGPDANRVRVYLTMAETPVGRATLSCATVAEDMAAALPAFRTIRAAITMPK